MTVVASLTLATILAFGAWLSYTEALYLKQQTREFGHAVPDVKRWLLVFKGLTGVLVAGALGAIAIIV